MIFKYLEDTVSNALDVGESLLKLEAPKKKQVLQLIDQGISIYTVSTLTGVSVEAIKELLKENE